MSEIVTTNHGAVRELQLNRPPANALSPGLIRALKEAVEAAPERRRPSPGALRHFLECSPPGWMCRCW